MDPDEVMDRVKFVGDASDTPHDEVVDALTQLPKEVCEWALDNIWFLCPDNVNGVAYTMQFSAICSGNDDDSSIFRIAYIAHHVFECHADERRRVIAHEVAHHWLRHDGNAIGNEQFEIREQQVESLLKDWGIESNIGERLHSSPCPFILAGRFVETGSLRQQ